MAENIVQVTEGSGKKLHTWDTTIGANLVQDEFVLPGEYPYPTYSVSNSVSTATVTHPLEIMAGATNKVRIRRIRVEQSANATAAGTLTVSLIRLISAGTGGTAFTPTKFDSAAAAAGATAMFTPTVNGAESGNELIRTVLLLRQAISATQSQPDDAWEWVQSPNGQPIIIPAGITNGLAIKIAAVAAGASLAVYAEFVETSF